MSYRPRSDLPRLSGRPEAGPPPAADRQPQTVIQRFFDLLERIERPAHGAAPHEKSAPIRGDAGRTGRR